MHLNKLVSLKEDLLFNQDGKIKFWQDKSFVAYTEIEQIYCKYKNMLAN